MNTPLEETTILQRNQPTRVTSVLDKWDTPEIWPMDKVSMCRFSREIWVSPILNGLPFGFFWLPGDDSFRLVALKAPVFIERGVARITDPSLVGQLLVMRFARTRRTKIGHFSSVFIDQQQVLVGMSLLLAAVMR